MFPGIFELAQAASPVRTLIGDDPVRFWPFGEAPEREQRPYAVWQTLYGSPDNLLNETPKLDTWGVQVDAYAPTATDSRQVARALRDAFETDGYVVSWNGERKDVPTGLYRYSFTVEFMQSR